MKMERVLILGCGGAGKSTLARRLGQLTALPVVHLDAHYWNAGWVFTPAEQWRPRVEQLAAQQRWIMDGNFASTFDLRLPLADTIIFLDPPRRVCLWRVLKRLIAHRGRNRPDMPAGCNEKADLEFLQWIWTFRARERPKILQVLDHARHEGKQAFHLTSAVQMERFIAELRNKLAASVAAT